MVKTVVAAVGKVDDAVSAEGNDEGYAEEISEIHRKKSVIEIHVVAR